ncbi:MAG: 16S rRNA methyltransferase [Candidatus Bathyarchaeota archaeon]
MLNLLLAEAALEMIPKPLWHYASISKNTKSLGKKPGKTLLDRSYHHQAMIHLKDGAKRGRPDIVHFALLEALGTPLNKEGLLRVFIHTLDNHIIYINPQVRLPRNYNRFKGLIEQLYADSKVPLTLNPLLQFREGNLTSLISEIKPSYVLAFTRIGERKSLEEVIRPLLTQSNPVIIIGAFPQGHFSNETMNLVDISVSIYPTMLETNTVTSRVIYEYERLLGFGTKRCNQ